MAKHVADEKRVRAKRLCELVNFSMFFPFW